MLQTRFQQDGYPFSGPRVARKDPQIHPVCVRLVVGHHDQMIGKVKPGYPAVCVSFDNLFQLQRRVCSDDK